MQKLCSAFNLLPSSFLLPQESVKQESDPFDEGTFSNVFRATFNERPIVIKALKVSARTERTKLHRVSGLDPRTPTRLLTLHPQYLVEEVVGWKWLRHENILPFVGVMLAPPTPIAIASEFMEHGNIVDFIRKNQDYNRVDLVSQVRMTSLYCIDRSGSSSAQ